MRRFSKCVGLVAFGAVALAASEASAANPLCTSTGLVGTPVFIAGSRTELRA